MEFIGSIFGFIWSTFFYNPILNALVVLYEIGFENLGLAVILLTILVKLITIPLTKSQLDSTQKLQEIRPELEKLQKKYAKDPLTLQKKQQELYQSVGYNPLGCFSTFFIQLPILIALYSVVRNFSNGKVEGLYPAVKGLFDLGSKIVVNTDFFAWDLAESYNSVAHDFGRISVEALPYFGLAILVAISQYFATRFVTGARPKNAKKNQPAKPKSPDAVDPTEMMETMNKSMRYTMPLIIGFTSLSFPAVLSLYWIISSVAQILQQLIIGDRAFIFNKAKTRVDEFINRKPQSDI